LKQKELSLAAQGPNSHLFQPYPGYRTWSQVLSVSNNLTLHLLRVYCPSLWGLHQLLSLYSHYSKPESCFSVLGGIETSCLYPEFFCMAEYISFYNPKTRIKLLVFFLLLFCFILKAMWIAKLLSREK
jgi:hypothetical protein